MKKLTTGVVAVALLTAATAGPAWGGWGVNTNVNTNYSKQDNRRDNRQDNRQDNRDFSDHRVTNTTDSRDLSNHQSWSDSRNMSDNRQDNRVSIDGSRKDQAGDGSIYINGEGYKPRVGHKNAQIGGISGSNNYIDNSVSGNFGIGHTQVK